MYDSMDWEANEFACELLMPHDEFIEYINETADIRDGKQIVDVNKIAEHFCVSPQLVVIRGPILGLWERD